MFRASNPPSRIDFAMIHNNRNTIRADNVPVVFVFWVVFVFYVVFGPFGSLWFFRYLGLLRFAILEALDFVVDPLHSLIQLGGHP